MMLTIADMQRIVRGLSDESLWDLTSINNPAQWNTLRTALYAYVLDYAPNDTAETLHDAEETLFSDFMWSIDIPYTLRRTRLGEADADNYTQYFDQLRNTQLSKDTILIHAGQLFSGSRTYCGSWFTCTDLIKLGYFWVGIDRDWKATVYTDTHSLHTWAQSVLPPRFYYFVYNNSGVSWNRVLAGGNMNIDSV